MRSRVTAVKLRRDLVESGPSMINALAPARIVRTFTLTVIVAILAVGWATHSANASTIWSARGVIVAGVSGAVFLLTLPPVFRAVHRATFARLWWFPLLDGRWEAELLSNWPRVRQVGAAAREGEVFDPTIERKPDGGYPGVMADVTIVSSLFEVIIEFRMRESQRASRSLFVRPRWARPGRPSLAYVYEQTNNGLIEVTDTPEHLGAALLHYYEPEGELRGQYWTNRNATTGLNTAGTLVLRRVREPASAAGAAVA